MAKGSFGKNCMTDEGLTLDQESLRHRLNELPADVRPHVKRGFRLLTRIGSNRRARLRDYIVTSMASSQDIETKRAEEISELNAHTVGDVLTASTFAIAATLDLDVSQEDFVRFAPRDILLEEDVQSVHDILTGIGNHREQLKRALEISSLANSVLPTIRGLSLQIDLRVQFDGDSSLIGNTVPLAICCLLTDVDEDDLYFQADIEDVEKMIKKLEEAQSRMKLLQGASISL